MTQVESDKFLSGHPDLGDLDLSDVDFHSIERFDFALERLILGDDPDAYKAI